MIKQSWRDRLIDPRSPDRRPRRAAYALPTMFTAGNVFLGFYALIETFQASMAMTNDAAAAPHHFQNAAVAIGWSVFLDGLDGRIARLTNTVSDFGREMDSLADSMSFGIAPAVLAFFWGVQFVDPSVDARILEYLRDAGYFLAFLFLLCGAARLARFNIQKNPIPKNPGRPDRKYFVGLPIPAAAAAVAAVIYAAGSEPVAFLDYFGGVAGAARAAVVPDGEHLALSQLQGFESHAPALAADYRSDGRAHFPGVEFLKAGTAGAGSQLRRRRHRDSHWRQYKAAAAAASGASARTGAPGWLRKQRDREWRWWAAIRCWPRKCGNCWKRRSPRRTSN